MHFKECRKGPEISLVIFVNPDLQLQLNSLTILKNSIKISALSLLLAFSYCNPKKQRSGKNVSNDKDTLYYEYEIAFIDEHKFDFFIDLRGEFKIINELGEVEYSQKENITDFEVKDFNSDGFLDVITYHPSNGYLCSLLIYNPDKEKFEFIENFYKYSYSQNLDSSKFYYSYSGAGCAQNDWLSYLYSIENYKISVVGLIEGFGCLPNDTNGVYIYKISKNDTVLIQYIKDESGLGQKKFEFLDSYWKNNHERFN